MTNLVILPHVDVQTERPDSTATDSSGLLMTLLDQSGESGRSTLPAGPGLQSIIACITRVPGSRRPPKLSRINRDEPAAG